MEKSIVEKLMASYNNDKKPFIQDENIIFPKRENVFIELNILREIFFPNYWNANHIRKSRFELEHKIDELKKILFEGIRPYFEDNEKTHRIVENVINDLANIREKLKKDIEAAYAGDPSAKDYTEIIRSFPGFSAIMIQRFANLLYEERVYAYARELGEQIHSLTGIDIHPGAKIGDHFFIDHGTGVVIGETCDIGSWVRLYQGVTLGVLHFEKEENDQGVLKKGYKRHPTLGNHVVIGAGAKLLGPITIGNHVNIGANSWIQENIPDNTTAYITEHPKLVKKERKN